MSTRFFTKHGVQTLVAKFRGFLSTTRTSNGSLRLRLAYARPASIRNREAGEGAGVEYDQSIAFFSRAILEKRLVRKGRNSGTRYVVSNRR